MEASSEETKITHGEQEEEEEDFWDVPKMEPSEDETNLTAHPSSQPQGLIIEDVPESEFDFDVPPIDLAHLDKPIASTTNDGDDICFDVPKYSDTFGLEDIDKSNVLESNEANDPTRIAPFGSTAPRAKPDTPQQQGQAPEERAPTARELYNAKMASMRGARSKRSVRANASNNNKKGQAKGKSSGSGQPQQQQQQQSLPANLTSKQRRKMVRSLKSKGVAATLNDLGITDPGIQKIMEDALKSGDINNVHKIGEKLDNYCTARVHTSS